MRVLRKNHAKSPIGGHRWTSGHIVLKGETVDEVLDKLIAHRAENAEPLGDPEADMADYYAVIAPHLVRCQPGAVRRSSAEQQRAENIMAVWRTHPVMLSPDHPLRGARQKTCKKCPYCASAQMLVDGVYQRKAEARARMLATDLEYLRHGFCSVFKLPVAIITGIKTPALQEPPEPCWLKMPC